MYYSVNEGMQNTFSDKFGSITNIFKSQYWLPGGVAALAMLWVGLVFAAIQQSPSSTPGAPSKAGAATNVKALSVASQPASNPTMTSNSSGSTSSSTGTGQALQSTSSSASATASTSSTSTDVLGGKGGDGGTVTTPESPVVTTPSTDDTGGIDLDLTVDPIVIDPITLDLGVDDDGLNLNLGL